MQYSNPVRHAALVLATLDRESRDAVLQRMPQEQSQRIRDVLLTLEEDDGPEQGVAVREFLASRSDRLLSDPLQEPATFASSARGRIATDYSTAQLTSSLRDLLSHSNQAIVGTIGYERATTIAALLSAIPGDRAAGLLKLLTVETRTRVLAILDAGVNANPKAIEVVAEWVCDHLAESSLEPTVGLRHRSALKAILDELSADERQAMLEDLANENPMLARRLEEETSRALDQTHDCYC